MVHANLLSAEISKTAKKKKELYKSYLFTQPAILLGV